VTYVTDYDGHGFGCGWVTEHMFMNSKREISGFR